MTRPWPTARASRSASSEEVPCGKSDHVAGVPGELTNHRGLEAGVHRAVLAERFQPRGVNVTVLQGEHRYSLRPAANSRNIGVEVRRYRFEMSKIRRNFPWIS